MRLKDISILTPQYTGKPLDTEVSFVPMESLRNGNIDLKEIPYKDAKGKYTFFGNGDLLIAKVTPCFENGNIAIAENLKEGIGFGSSEIFVLRFNKKALNTYMFYVSQSAKFQDAACATMCGVGGLKRISPLFMKTYEFDIPTISEQQRIVDYLDEKTKAIDVRISVLEKKSDAYTRLKASVINRAVTRGLNPNVPLKDSGIDWCPYIPNDWKVVRVKNLARLQSGSSLTANDIDETGDYPVYGGNGLRGYTNSYTNVGTHVLIGRQGALCGNINYAFGKFYATEHAVVVYPYDKNLNTKWLGETLRCANFNRLSASAAQPGLAVSVINNQFIPYPPLSEQQSIASYLDTKCSEIDKAIDNLGKQIDALKRLKRSLINEVVTGKRKV